MRVNFANQILILQNDGSIYWPVNKALILTDLHLEKGSFYAHQEISNIPPYDSIDTINKLHSKLKTLSVKKIILLGDIFHDEHGLKRMPLDTKNKLNKICKNYEVIWIIGNHDGFESPKGSKVCFTYFLDGITFTHISSKKFSNEISGHYHPKVAFKVRGKKISKACFLISKKKIIMPSYGVYTGGMYAQSNIFKNVLESGFNTYVFSKKGVFLIK